MRVGIQSAIAAASFAFLATYAGASPFEFSTGGPNGLIATASRPDTGGVPEIESADDFVLTSETKLTGATFTGLIAGPGASLGQVVVEIYRVFPLDSNVPPSGNVTTRDNSPSDVAFASRDAAAGTLSFSTEILNPSFTAANSVKDGIHPNPNEFTGGEGPVVGAETRFSATFATALDLPAGHYFFVPQVQVTDGDFFWLSAPKPIAGSDAFQPDLQSWIRNGNLDPDWLRIGTDITHQGPFNAAFSLSGEAVPEPTSLALFCVGGLAMAGASHARRARARRLLRV